MSEAKLFVGGLSWETNQDTLRSYFEKFGEVSDVTLKTDRESGKSRGFGFVTFADPASVSQVMSNTSHMLDGRKIDPKVAQAKGGREPVLKVFVGGLDPEVPEDDIRAHFSQYGTVDKIELPFDKVKQQRRSFCFVQFQSEEAVNTLVNKRKDVVCGHEVDVKRATPPQPDGGFGGGRGGFGGAPRGGARGGRGGRGGAYGSGYGGAQGGYGGGYGSGSYAGSYGSGGYGNGYGTSGYGGNGYGNGYDSSSYGSQKYSGYGAGDDSYSGYGASSGAGGWGGQTQSRSYHPYQR